MARLVLRCAFAPAIDPLIAGRTTPSQFRMKLFFPFMKNLSIITSAFTLLLCGNLTLDAQEQKPAAPAEAVRPAPKLSPKQQVTGFYAMCKQDRGGEGLKEMLLSNPVVQESDVTQVATAFSQRITEMGGFVDFKIVREQSITERVIVVRCVAHFERQPFTNEFTFYDPGAGEWRLVHLRYDANLATMFQEDLGTTKE